MNAVIQASLGTGVGRYVTIQGMDIKPTAVTLGFFDIFQALSTEERAEVAKKMTSRRYKAGSFVIPCANDTGQVYFIVSGQVRACANNHSGRQVYFEDLASGMMFGELAAIDNGERTSDCICTEESLIASLSRSEFLEVLETYPSVKSQVMFRLVGMVRFQLQRVYEYTSYSVNQRIRFELLRLISDEGGGVPPITLKGVPTQAELANRISTHREAVSRELKQLESDGLITWNREHHIIHDPVTLMKRAQLN